MKAQNNKVISIINNIKCFNSANPSDSGLKTIFPLIKVYNAKGTEKAIQRPKIFEPNGFESAFSESPDLASIADINKSGILDAPATIKRAITAIDAFRPGKLILGSPISERFQLS